MDVQEQFSALAEVLDEAVRMTIQRTASFPQDPVYGHAREQLAFIESFVQSRTVPSPEDKACVDIGIMAVKELEPDEPDYARSLMRTSTRFKRLGQLATSDGSTGGGTSG